MTTSGRDAGSRSGAGSAGRSSRSGTTTTSSMPACRRSAALKLETAMLRSKRPLSRGSAARPRSQSAAISGLYGRSSAPGVMLWYQSDALRGGRQRRCDGGAPHRVVEDRRRRRRARRRRLRSRMTSATSSGWTCSAHELAVERPSSAQALAPGERLEVTASPGAAAAKSWWTPHAASRATAAASRSAHRVPAVLARARSCGPRAPRRFALARRRRAAGPARPGTLVRIEQVMPPPLGSRGRHHLRPGRDERGRALQPGLHQHEREALHLGRVHQRERLGVDGAPLVLGHVAELHRHVPPRRAAAGSRRGRSAPAAARSARSAA